MSINNLSSSLETPNLDKIFFIDTFGNRLENIEKIVSAEHGLENIQRESILIGARKKEESSLSSSKSIAFDKLEEAFKNGEKILVVLNYVTATKMGFLLKIGELEQKYNNKCRVLVFTCKSHHKLKKYVNAEKNQGNYIPNYRRSLYDTTDDLTEMNSLARLKNLIKGDIRRRVSDVLSGD